MSYAVKNFQAIKLKAQLCSYIFMDHTKMYFEIQTLGEGVHIYLSGPFIGLSQKRRDLYSPQRCIKFESKRYGLGEQRIIEHFQGRKRIEHRMKVLKMDNRFLMA